MPAQPHDRRRRTTGHRQEPADRQPRGPTALRRGERVAVVAEKRAALDVVHQRLDARGLGDCVAVVHDVYDDRKPLYRALLARLETPPSEPGSAARLDSARDEYGRAEGTLAHEATLLAQPAGTSGLAVGQLLTVTGSGGRLIEDPQLADLDGQALRRLLDLVDRLHAHRDLWGPATWWRTRGRRGSLASVDDQGLRGLEATLQRAIALADEFEVLVAEAPVIEGELVEARAGLLAAETTRAAQASPEAARVLAALIARGDPGVAELRQTWTTNAAALARWSAPLEAIVEVELDRQVAVLSSYAGRFARFFSRTWWRARGVVRQGLVELWPERAGESFGTGFLQELRERIVASKAWAKVSATYDALGLTQLTPASSDAASEALDQLATFAETSALMLAAKPRLLAIGLRPPSDPSELPNFVATLDQRRAQLNAMDALRSSTTTVEAIFSWVSTADAAELRALLTHVRRDAPRLRQVDAWLALVDELSVHGRPLLDAASEVAPDASFSDWREMITRAWAWAQLERATEAEPMLAELGTATLDQRTARDAGVLRRVEAEIRDLEVERIVAKVASAELLQIPQAAYRARRTPKQRTKETILKQVRKQRGLWPLRRFVREFADDGLLEALPCWLLSPETMTVLFPREALFDLVIFDEASQCTVEAGLPVLLRARRAVVAGDEKQMPPSSFFKLTAHGTDEEDRSEEERRIRDLLSAESLLSLARDRCHHVGLAWHYRCLDESLIAFSNHSMYEGELRTIPSTKSAEAEAPMRWVHVEDGAYDRGLNRREAERVVDLVVELLGREPRPTVGVVTFNLRQRQAVLDAIDARLERRPVWIR